MSSDSTLLRCDEYTVEFARVPGSPVVKVKLWHSRPGVSLLGRLRLAFHILFSGARYLVKELSFHIDSIRALRDRLDDFLDEQYHLESLIHLTNSIINDMRRKHVVNDAVNWADVKCIDAVLCIDRSGRRYYSIYISEAAPEAVEFKEYLREMLAKFGYKDVEVNTEW